MALSIEELDGTYHAQASAHGEAHPPGFAHLTLPEGATLVIDNGMSFSKDPNGLIWESSFAILDDSKVGMISTVDPSHAASDMFVADEKGNLTKGMVTYKVVLTAGHENGQLVLNGHMSHAGGITAIRLAKIG